MQKDHLHLSIFFSFWRSAFIETDSLNIVKVSDRKKWRREKWTMQRNQTKDEEIWKKEIRQKQCESGGETQVCHYAVMIITSGTAPLWKDNNGAVTLVFCSVSHDEMDFFFPSRCYLILRFIIQTPTETTIQEGFCFALLNQNLSLKKSCFYAQNVSYFRLKWKESREEVTFTFFSDTKVLHVNQKCPTLSVTPEVRGSDINQS